MTARTRSAPPAGGLRLAWMDNLRIAIIIGMVLTHVGTAYVIDVGWYYEERTAGVVTEALFWALLSVGGLFGMGLLFLVAGLVTPQSLSRKGPSRFARDRLVRLGVPLLIFVAVVDLLLDFVGYRGEAGDRGLASFLPLWWRYDADLSVMWFVAVLLAFSLGYALLRAVRPAARRGGVLTPTPLVMTAFGVAVGSFVVRLQWPFLSDSVRGLNAWELPQMLALFALGVAAGERGWLDDGVPDRLWRTCGRAVLLAGVLAMPIGAVMGTTADERFLGGSDPRALLIPLIEGVIAVCASLWVLEWFRRSWDRTSALQQALARASFAAYVLHPVVLVALMVALASVPVAGEVKLLIVSPVGVVGAFTLGWLATRSRVLGAVF
jgi:glucans biosynthesis protein C